MSDTIEIRAEFRRYGKSGVTDNIWWATDDWETALKLAQRYAKENDAELLSIYLDETGK